MSTQHLDVDARQRSVSERFWAKVDPGISTLGCWWWTAAPDKDGYGSIWDGTFTAPRVPHKVRAHRYAYELLVGPIPEGMVLDHLCRNRTCVNPDHLEPVTNAENIRRGRTGKWRSERKVSRG